jgi:hypothetical protein
VTDLLLRQAQASRAGAHGDDDYDVIGTEGIVIGRIFKATASWLRHWRKPKPEIAESWRSPPSRSSGVNGSEVRSYWFVLVRLLILKSLRLKGFKHPISE